MMEAITASAAIADRIRLTLETGKSISVKVFLYVQPGRILLVKNKADAERQKGEKWGQVGGRKKPYDDKTPLDAARRESYEETARGGTWDISVETDPMFIEDHSTHLVVQFYGTARFVRGKRRREADPDILAVGTFLLDQLPREMYKGDLDRIALVRRLRGMTPQRSYAPRFS